MSDQPQLDLQAPPARSGRGFGGFTRAQLVMGAILIVALIWAMWVTKALVEPREEHIVKASLSNIVGEYVSAQARSASPPGQVEAEMRAFMSSLDHELQRRGAGASTLGTSLTRPPRRSSRPGRRAGSRIGASRRGSGT